MKKLIAIAAALSFAVGALGLATSRDANAQQTQERVTVQHPANPWDPKVFNQSKYAACSKKVLPDRRDSPAAVFSVDACYLDQPW